MYTACHILGGEDVNFVLYDTFMQNNKIKEKKNAMNFVAFCHDIHVRFIIICYTEISSSFLFLEPSAEVESESGTILPSICISL
eukprot:c21679_g1_i1 orf=139-390(-)